MKDPLKHVISVRCNYSDLIKIDTLKSRWEDEDPESNYTRSDVLRVCMRTSYDLENQINTLKKSLTNSS